MHFDTLKIASTVLSLYSMHGTVAYIGCSSTCYAGFYHRLRANTSSEMTIRRLRLISPVNSCYVLQFQWQTTSFSQSRVATVLYHQDTQHIPPTVIDLCLQQQLIYYLYHKPRVNVS